MYKRQGSYLIYDIVNITPNGFNGIDYSLDIFLCDNVTEINTESNEVGVQNECCLIALDIMSIFENYNKASYADKDLALVLNKNWSIQPFTERFDSLYSGAAISMSLNGCILQFLFTTIYATLSFAVKVTSPVTHFCPFLDSCNTVVVIFLLCWYFTSCVAICRA